MRLLQQFGDGEKPDQDRDHLQSGCQLQVSEGEAGGAGDIVDADGGEEHAQRAGDQVLGRSLAADRRDHGNAEQGECKIFRRAELVGHSGEQRRSDNEDEDAEYAGQRAGHSGDAERPARFATLGQRVAVKAGDHRRRRARHIDKDGGNCSGKGVRAVDGEQQRQGRDWLHDHRERQQQGGRHRRADARQDADDRADKQSDEDQR
jgi:hypothetical protein